MSPPRKSRVHALASPCGAFLAGVLAALSATPAVAQVQIQSRPLSLGNNVPNNLALVPSVEYPTIHSIANFSLVNGVDVYNGATEYVGYFDSGKCYRYNYAPDEPSRHFEPVALAGAGRGCNGANRQWSGNYLNWATTQTIDPFRKALTGGYRVRDTASETWLEKARAHPGIAAPANKSLAAATLMQVLPAGAAWNLVTRTRGANAQMLFGRANAVNLEAALNTAVPYNPAVHTLSGLNAQRGNDTTLYAVSIRVKVCVASGAIQPEANCRRYGSNYKPEGLIQAYQDRLRYSVFGYLNDSSQLRDGGVLRAQQKYVGPYSYDPVEGMRANPRQEWDPSTGQQIVNSDPADAAATNARTGSAAVVNSGVINYINKFGQTTDFAPKSFDPVSELFYTAIRYFKNQGNVPSYTDMASANAAQFTDRFPVITAWEDPIQYACQRNAAIGIGDVNSWNDRNLPGSGNRANEPAMPALVSADTTVNVETAYNKLRQLEALEGVSLPAANAIFSGRNNSAFVAALAYDSHTRDLRSDRSGHQSLSSFWVDVAENQAVLGRDRNQYYLAAKYGGFDVPDGFDPYQRTTALPEAWWVGTDSAGRQELVGVGGLATAKRPRNFFIANRAEAMVQGLNRAFQAASQLPRRGAAAVVGTNGASVEEGAMVYIPTYFTDWSGELAAYAVDPITRTLLPRWNASERLPAPAARRIYANSNGYGLFSWSRLDAADRANLGNEDVFNYLRGDRSREVRNGGGLRDRGGVLGDFVNSSPLYVGAPSAQLYANSRFSGGGRAYSDYAAARALRQPTVYIGGNDGMLHGFNAVTGEETYAFVPKAALSIPNGLSDYARPGYLDAHRYFVDGELTAADVYLNGAWRTVLVGTMGRGGKGAFALDITDPGAIALLWEKHGSQIPALGNNLGKPTIVQTANGVWRVLLGNGPNSEAGGAQLLMLDVASGAVTSLTTGDLAQDNGLSGVRAWDADRDGFFESAYAGDLKGNLWRFSGLGTGALSALRVFAANPGQAITATPLVGFRPDTLETWVFFGTGRFLGSTDLGDRTVQSWYGVIDKAGATDRGRLVRRSIEFEGTIVNARGETVAVRTVSRAAAGDMTDQDGWYLDLVSPGPMLRGERMVVPNLFDGNRLLGISRIPVANDPCAPGGSGFTMEIDPFSGARIEQNVFDANGDGAINGGDNAGGTPAQPGGLPVSGIGSPSAPNGAVIIPGGTGNRIVNTDDSGQPGNESTAIIGLGARRVSWREVIRDAQ